MNIYEKRLKEALAERFGGRQAEEVVDALLKIGVIDITLMKVLAVREFVKGEMERGVMKLDAMWQATEVFACSYEYARKCMYYYKDVNLE